jgi:hypothetical protein
MSVQRIRVWVCDECDYWRKDRSTGVHQTTNPANPNGRMVIHELHEAEFAVLPVLTDNQEKET